MNRMAPLVVAAVSALSAAPQFGAVVPADMGVYLGWVGTYPGDRLKEGARLAKQFGFHTVRMPLVASVETDFGIGSTCHQRETLADLAALPAYANVLAEPAFGTTFLTVWGDSYSYDACDPRDPHTDQHPHKRYLDRKYYSIERNRARMRADYAGLTYLIYRTYHGTQKIFGISNWEGDNELYCDAAALYAIDAKFRSTCDATRKTTDVLAAYRQFLALRHEGIRLGKDRARREGLTGVSVVEVIEFSAFRMLKDRHLPSVLEDILPSAATPNYVSYSAWESIGNPDQLLADLQELQKRFDGRLMVGEFGFDRGLDTSAPEHAAGALAAMRKAPAGFEIWWQIFDQPPLAGLGDKGLYGLYDGNGGLTAIGKKFLNR